MINMEQKLEEAMDMVHPQTIRFGKLRGNYEYRVNTKNHLAGSAWYCCPWQKREPVKREIVWMESRKLSFCHSGDHGKLC